MTVRKSPRPPARPPQPAPAQPAARMLESSVRGWYAQWKAARDAAPTPPTAETPPANNSATQEADEAVARWLMS